MTLAIIVCLSAVALYVCTLRKKRIERGAR
jgi:hypothetical protein